MALACAYISIKVLQEIQEPKLNVLLSASRYHISDRMVWVFDDLIADNGEKSFECYWVGNTLLLSFCCAT